MRCNFNLCHVVEAMIPEFGPQGSVKYSAQLPGDNLRLAVWIPFSWASATLSARQLVNCASSCKVHSCSSPLLAPMTVFSVQRKGTNPRTVQKCPGGLTRSPPGLYPGDFFPWVLRKHQPTASPCSLPLLNVQEWPKARNKQEKENPIACFQENSNNSSPLLAWGQRGLRTQEPLKGHISVPFRVLTAPGQVS